MKNILVIGHPRSGNHFLINTIGLNFEGYVANTWQSSFDKNKLERNSIKIAKTIRGLYRYHSDRIFKSHLVPCCFNKSWHFFKKRFHVFYIIRDGRDVMASYFYYFKAQRILGRTGITSLTELFKYNLCSSKLYRNFEIEKTSNIIERWVKHIESWIEVSGIHIIKYEELNLNFDNTLNRIGKILGQTPKGIRPDLRKNVSMVPRKGIVGDYKNLFTKEDLDYFNGIAGNLMKKLNYY